MSDPRLVIALDFNTESDVLALVERLDPSLCRLKVGKQLFVRCGPSLLETLAKRGFDVFLDLKFHDIPNTVAEACLAAADWGVWMVNVHAQGGRRMMSAAAEALQRRGDAPLLIGVTVLTSMDQSDLIDLGIQRQPAQWARSLAGLARESGLDGVVCSAQEAPLMKAHCGQSFQLVTPGIRPAGSAAGDQRRIVTPAQAVANGADYLVVGRPITQSDDPTQALQSIQAEIAG
ncbi:orotidine 5'-phosphate decarboxylase [gamma proteobacterium HTCC5015]|nr:orotidine 5'-phosphate decarboxylase [gamma proteobacterium HTCC5015]